MKPVEVVENCSADNIPDAVLTSRVPLVLKGLVNNWPAVIAAQQSAEAANNYICQFYNGELVNVAVGDAHNGGRIFYNENMSGFNYQRTRIRLDKAWESIRALELTASARAFYIDSAPAEYCIPNFRRHNDLKLGSVSPRVSLWMGNKTIVSAHYDIPDNIACVVAGKRRFTLFPPEQLSNLYIGPLDFTPAGQAISLVDLNNPDLEKFPKARVALDAALTAELEAGDAIFIPSMWWHSVEGLAEFNVLVNYWWTPYPDYLGSPLDALNHALLSIKSLSEDQRKSWKAIFDYYVFEHNPETGSHIPAERLGVLADIDEIMGRRLRAMLINRLNR